MDGSVVIDVSGGGSEGGAEGYEGEALLPWSTRASVNTLQHLVEQLPLQAAVDRTKVSQAAAELQWYCTQSASKDALLVSIQAGSNPFREPRSCALLIACLQVSRKHFSLTK
ncbi:guanine nucleotide-binding protein G(I)/G(S)/G(O) subunit gamma-10-like [Phyllostomus hastatus]|uniref:guanine nucleotide-binding protein G(I)/G(S)/G(O) subunit gamma-10-like n=1 Tax=Phyllostomus hastatus TaxID=9423 RepID=UPI001E67FE00|nr:guanine nucleotide-binding protein G(I)/G(S)/G(O) subunit gamma-10-like [Phyllostomus hastatus]